MIMRSLQEQPKETGFAEATFKKAEDKATNSLLYSLAMGMNVFASQEVG